ncbi:MAG: ABC transporter permease [Chloracidobacterium sp.]|nr:ABC transporter permease [Chloracidobacterium sp.]
MPEWKREIRQRLARLQLAPAREAAIVEELAQYLDDYYAELLAGGATEAQAWRQTLAELDGSELLAQELRRAEGRVAPEPIALGTNRRANMIADLWQDLRFGARVLMKQPGFTLVAVITLSLGIGANTAIFSFVNATLLRPLPYPDSERLVFVFETEPQLPKAPVTGPDYLDWKESNKVFESMAAGTEGSANLTGVGDPQRVSAIPVSAGFFETLKITPMIGRTFIADDDQPGRDKVAVLTNELWQTRFGADPGVIGRRIMLNGQSFEVIGVTPPKFIFPPVWGLKPDLFVPLALRMNEQTRGNHWLFVMGRLKPGDSREQAQTEMEGLAARLAKQYPDTNSDIGAKVVSMQEHLVANTKASLLILLGAVVFALLIASANVANLFLSRVVSRRREIVLRAALGASRFRLIRQSLVESLLLSLLGGVAGLLLAGWTVEALIAITPAKYLPLTGKVDLNLSVLLFAFGVSVLTGVLTGLVPAWQAARINLNEFLKEGTMRATGGARGPSFRSALVVTEITLGLILLAGSGLMIRSLRKLLEVNPGFDPANVLSMNVDLPESRYHDLNQVETFFKNLIGHTQALPGVESAAIASQLPLGGGSNGVIQIEGRPRVAGMSGPLVQHTWISPDYFRTMRIPLMQGRAFNESDTSSSTKVVIINRTLSRLFWPNEDPLGRRLSLGNGDTPDWREVIGVVGDAYQWGLTRDPLSEVYFPHSQMPASAMHLVVRSSVDPSSLSQAVLSQVRELDRELPVGAPLRMESVISESTHASRFQTLLMSVFGALALLLVSVGIYGVMSYTTAQRAHEIAIRMAIGAQRRDALGLVIYQGMKLTLIGVAIGLMGALALTRLLKTLLFGVSATDPLTFAGVALLMALVALAACYLPARRATKVDPLIALRSE